MSDTTFCLLGVALALLCFAEGWYRLQRERRRREAKRRMRRFAASIRCAEKLAKHQATKTDGIYDLWNDRQPYHGQETKRCRVGK